MTPQKRKDSDFDSAVRFVMFVQTIERVSKNLIWAGALVGAIYWGIFKPIEVARGQETTINYFVKLLTDVRAEVWVALSVGGAGVAFGEAMRRKLLRERKQKDERIRELEKKLDEHVDSSGLSVEGRRTRDSKS